MNASARFSRELRRLMRERFTLLFIAGSVAGALWFCLNSTGRTASDAYVLSPAKNSAAFGALLFTMLTLIQFHRDYKNHTDSIVLTCTDPAAHQLRRTLAMVCVAAATTLIITLFALPFAIIKTGSYFQAESFLASWVLIFFGALVLTVLLSSGLYMLFRRVEVAFVAMVALILLSRQFDTMYDLDPSYLLFWIQTNVSSFSDLVSNQFQIDLILWNRLFCLLAALGVWLLGLCSLRRYGYGVFGSFISNCKRAWLPSLLVSAVLLAGVSYASEPVFDNSIPINYEADYDSGTGMSVVLLGNEEKEENALQLVDKKAALDVDTGKRTVSGKAVYTLKNLTDQPQKLSLQVNTGYSIEDVLVNGQAATAVRDDVEKENCATWHIDLPVGPEITVELGYHGRPKNNGSLLQVPTDGVCDEIVWLPSAGFSPSADAAVSDDFNFQGVLTLDERLTPVFMRNNAQKLDTADGKTRWSFSNTTAQNSGFIAAKYDTKTFEAGGLEVEFKYFAKQDNAIADMNAIHIMKGAIDYFTEMYGPLPYEDHLTMLELPASISGGFASENLSAMDETSFASAGFLPVEADTPDSGGGTDVLVHEIAHQWWGMATYPMQDEVSGWSAEGITCYSTYRFLKEYYGEEYARRNFVQQWETGWETYKNAFYIKNPEYLQKLTESDASNVLASFNSINLYDAMPLKLLKAEAAVGGQEAFDRLLSEMYNTYLGNYITYENFLSATGLNGEVLKLA